MFLGLNNPKKAIYESCNNFSNIDYQNNITKQLVEEFLVTDNSLSIYEITEQLTDEDITTLEQQIITHKT